MSFHQITEDFQRDKKCFREISKIIMNWLVSMEKNGWRNKCYLGANVEEKQEVFFLLKINYPCFKLNLKTLDKFLIFPPQVIKFNLKAIKVYYNIGTDSVVDVKLIVQEYVVN
jgi:hypothetical protein